MLLLVALIFFGGHVLCCLGSSTTNSTWSNIPPWEYDALSDFYFSTGGSQWKWNPALGVQWNFSNPDANPCADLWQGLNCTAFDPAENVTHIDTILLKATNLVGSLPESISNLTFLRELNVNQNHLTGDVPDFLGELLFLEIIALNYNKFGGTLPSSYGQLTGLLLLDVYHNAVVGSIPPSYANLINLEYFDVYGNQVTGTIPAFITTFADLKYLYLGKNRLKGTIPNWLGNLTSLLSFYVNDNYLVGTVPPSLSQLPKLQYLLLEGNYLEGSLTGVFNSTIQTALKIALFAGNEFSGPLPEDLFRIPTLEIVGGGSNCMAGTIPLTVCGSANLQTLALDGMRTADACRSPLLPNHWSKTYQVDQALPGGIPRCLFELPRLQTLHLSGNGLNGQLPSDVVLSPSFKDFSVSHNTLTGTLPGIFQTHRWDNLDVSFNRIGGVLRSDYAPIGRNASLALRDNRLSGEIPSSLDDSPVPISVLVGNVFACALTGSDLPQQDETAASYICGSNLFELNYYVWLGGAVLGLAYTVLQFTRWLSRRNKQFTVSQTLREFLEYCLTPVDLFVNEDKEMEKVLRRVYKIYLICGMLMRIASAITVVILFLLIFYGVMSLTNSTLTHQYAYKLSMAFTAGILPLVLAMLLFVALLAALHVCFWHFLVLYNIKLSKYHHWYLTEPDSPRTASTIERESLLVKAAHTCWEAVKTAPYVLLVTIREKWKRFFQCLALLLIDMTIVALANAGYITLFTSDNKVAQLLATPAITAFNIAWAAACSMCVNYLIVNMDAHDKAAKGGVLSTLVVLALFNEIVVPCGVVMFGSSTCFLNVFTPSKSVHSTYYYNECGAYDLSGCLYYTPSYTTTTLQPPFQYNYQCSARLITYYAPKIAFSAFTQSVLAILSYWSPHILAFFNSDSCFGCSRCIYSFMLCFMPLMLAPIKDGEEVKRPQWSAYFDARALLVRLFTNLGVIMTFGVVFPPLAVCMCVALVINGSFAMRELQRFLEQLSHRPDRLVYYKIMHKECHNVGTNEMLLRSLRAVVFLSCLFYSLYLFDTLGDSIGFERSWWILIVMPVTSVALYFAMDVVLLPKYFRSLGTFPVKPPETALVEVSSSNSLSSKTHSEKSSRGGGEEESPMHSSHSPRTPHTHFSSTSASASDKEVGLPEEEDEERKSGEGYFIPSSPTDSSHAV